jgi:hypothetical protein
MDPTLSASCRESGAGEDSRTVGQSFLGPPPGNNAVDFLPSISSTPSQLFTALGFSQRDIEGKLTLVSHPLLSTVKNNA